jgi:hypothetical protein
MDGEDSTKTGSNPSWIRRRRSPQTLMVLDRDQYQQYKKLMGRKVIATGNTVPGNYGTPSCPPSPDRSHLIFGEAAIVRHLKSHLVQKAMSPTLLSGDCAH